MFQKKALATLSVIAGVTALLISSNSPAMAQGIPQGWFKVCAKQKTQDNKDLNVCNTMNNVVSESGQPLTMINLIDITGGANQKRISITVPTNRYIPAGIQVQVGDGYKKVIPYVVCVGATCVAEDELDTAMIDAMKKGQKMTITTVNYQGQVNPIDATLNGFTAAYTGPGMQREQFEAEQRKMQESIQSNRKEIEDRLRAEQEKAKAGQ